MMALKNGMPWTETDEHELVELATSGLTHAQLGALLGRSATAIHSKLSELRDRAAGHGPRYAVRRESPLAEAR